MHYSIEDLSIMIKKIIFLFILPAWFCPLLAQDTIRIDLSGTYQTIDNFSASDCWSMQKIGAWNLTQKERVADLLFSVDTGIGLSAWRFNIGGGPNPYISHPWRSVETFEVDQGVYDWSRQEEERWFLQAARERGVDQFIAFVNSPPGRMTRNGRTHCTDGLGSTNLKDGFEGQYATYLVDILKHFRDVWGIPFDQISPVNEPQWEWNSSNQEGNRASNEDIRAIVTALHDELSRQYVETEISLVESGDLSSWYSIQSSISSKYHEPYGNYLNDLFNDETIKDKVARHLGGHSYWSDRVSNQLVQNRQSLYNRLSSWLEKGWKYWVTEYCILDGPYGNGGQGRDLTIRTALDVARIIHYDLTILQASAWQWWTAVSPEDYKDGLIYTDYKDSPGTQNIIESKTLWILGNYSRFIRPGSLRIKLTNADDKYGLLGSAYLSADRNSLIIVLLNMGAQEKGIVINLDGLSTGNKITAYTPHVTSDEPGDDLKTYPSFSADSPYTVPARSAVTLTAEIAEASGMHTLYDNGPDRVRLFQNYPNPFNSETVIPYAVAQNVQVQIVVFNLKGEQIRTLVNVEKGTGRHLISWDGKTDRGESALSGLYIIEMRSQDFRVRQKIVRVN
jgi:O-glycosyl hydrolase